MYLLDTHTVLWALSEPDRLGPEARRIFLDERAPVFLSAASVWEMAIKLSLGKLHLDLPLTQLTEVEIPQQGIPVLPVEARHATAVARLPWHHRDPFDRLLIGTAQVDGLTLVSADPALDAYDVQRVW
jgi:PIN domain nuclease of toxin-antitoxin system